MKQLMHPLIKETQLHGAGSRPVHTISRCMWFNGNCTRTFEAGARPVRPSDWLHTYFCTQSLAITAKTNLPSDELPTHFKILATGLVSFAFVNWLSLISQGKLAQSADRPSPNLSPAPPSLVANPSHEYRCKPLETNICRKCMDVSKWGRSMPDFWQERHSDDARLFWIF